MHLEVNQTITEEYLMLVPQNLEAAKQATG